MENYYHHRPRITDYGHTYLHAEVESDTDVRLLALYVIAGYPDNFVETSFIIIVYNIPQYIIRPSRDRKVKLGPRAVVYVIFHIYIIQITIMLYIIMSYVITIRYYDPSGKKYA